MIHRALVALDESARAPGVFQRAAEIARAFGAELILFHAVPVPQEFPPAGAGTPPDALPGYLVRTAHERLMQYVAREPELSMRVVVREHLSPNHAIVDASEELDADLIVIGNHGYHGMDRILGTTAGKVIHEAKRDVLIVYRGDIRMP